MITKSKQFWHVDWNDQRKTKEVDSKEKVKLLTIAPITNYKQTVKLTVF